MFLIVLSAKIEKIVYKNNMKYEIGCNFVGYSQIRCWEMLGWGQLF